MGPDAQNNHTNSHVEVLPLLHDQTGRRAVVTFVLYCLRDFSPADIASTDVKILTLWMKKHLARPK